jgi:hypothetical protein
MKFRTLLSLGMGGVVVAACGSSSDTFHGGTPGGGAGSSGSSSSGSGGLVIGSSGSSGTGGAAAGAGSGAGGTAFDPDAACASSSANGEPIPVDLFFMVDITGSMNCPVPDNAARPCEVDPGPPYSATTRWTVESAALKDFIANSANAGMGMGIGFFPSMNNICTSATYTTPTVEIAPLPGNAAMLDTAIAAQTPAGNTPTVPSLDGATQHAVAWARANPTHRVAVVYATDGYPEGCNGNTIPAAAAIATAAFNGTPSIPTYVLGVGSNLTSLNMIAASGGTTKAFLVDTTGSAAAEFAAALSTIRSTALLGCTYTIPPPPAGMHFDPSKVNVTYTDSSGKVTDVYEAAAGADCSTATGWEYSTDHTQINLCGALCTSVKSSPGGSLNVLFGCATMMAPPR